MIFRPLNIFGFLAAATAGLHLYQTKHDVALLDRELRTVSRQIEDAKERTQALNAEWAWLNEPERMRGAAQRHLGLEPMQPSQFVRAQELDRRLPPPVAYAGPATVFSGRDPRASADPVKLALQPRLPAAGGAAPSPVPDAGAVAEPIVQAAQPVVEEPVAPAPVLRPRLIGTAQAESMPREVVLPSEPALPRGLPVRDPASRKNHAASPRPPSLPVARPVSRPPTSPVVPVVAGVRSAPSAPPPVARPPTPATQIAAAGPLSPPAGLGASLLGGRGSLPPPVPFAGTGDGAAGRR